MSIKDLMSNLDRKDGLHLAGLAAQAATSKEVEKLREDLARKSVADEIERNRERGERERLERKLDEERERDKQKEWEQRAKDILDEEREERLENAHRERLWTKRQLVKMDDVFSRIGDGEIPVESTIDFMNCTLDIDTIIKNEELREDIQDIQLYNKVINKYWKVKDSINNNPSYGKIVVRLHDIMKLSMSYGDYFQEIITDWIRGIRPDFISPLSLSDEERASYMGKEESKPIYKFNEETLEGIKNFQPISYDVFKKDYDRQHSIAGCLVYGLVFMIFFMESIFVVNYLMKPGTGYGSLALYIIPIGIILLYRSGIKEKYNGYLQEAEKMKVEAKDQEEREAKRIAQEKIKFDNMMEDLRKKYNDLVDERNKAIVVIDNKRVEALQIIRSLTEQIDAHPDVKLLCENVRAGLNKYDSLLSSSPSEEPTLYQVFTHIPEFLLEPIKPFQTIDNLEEYKEMNSHRVYGYVSEMLPKDISSVVNEIQTAW